MRNYLLCPNDPRGERIDEMRREREELFGFKTDPLCSATLLKLDFPMGKRSVFFPRKKFSFGKTALLIKNFFFLKPTDMGACEEQASSLKAV